MVLSPNSAKDADKVPEELDQDLHCVHEIRYF